MEVSDCVHESMGDYSPTTFDEGFQHFVESPHPTIVHTHGDNDTLKETIRRQF